MPLRWDMYEGRFVSEQTWAARKLAEAEALKKADEDMMRPRPGDQEYEDAKRLDKGLKLSGTITVKGELANTVAYWLAEHGYKDEQGIAPGGNFYKIYPEDKTYRDWVKEAIYWYGKECGIPFGENEK